MYIYCLFKYFHQLCGKRGVRLHVQLFSGNKFILRLTSYPRVYTYNDFV